MNRFDKIAKDWDAAQRRQKLAQNIYKHIAKKVEFNKKMTVADIGSGTGLLLFNIQPSVKEIIGYDNSGGMLEMLSKKAKDLGAKNVSTVQFNADNESLPENSFDALVSSMTFHHIHDIPAFLKKSYDSLKQGGTFAVADLETEDGSFHGTAANEDVKHFGFDITYFNDRMREAGFKDISVETIFTINREGKEFTVFLAYGKK